MNKMEYRVDAKIIKQITLFLMMHQINHFDLTFESNHKGVCFKISSSHFTEDIIAHMKEKLSRKRETAIEVYGWELLGDTDSQNELDILGALIDEIEVEKKAETYVVSLRRLYAYDK